MKKFTLFLLAALTFGLYSCETLHPEDSKEELQPTVALEKVAEGINNVTFNVTSTNAKEVKYMVVEDEAESPALDTILAEGKAVNLDENGSATVTAEGLDAETEYKVVAAAKNGSKRAGSNTLYVTTKPQAALTLSVEVVQVTHENMFFRVNAENAEKISYLVLYAEKDTPAVQYVLLNGESVEVGSKESVEVKGLECSKAYKLVVAAEGVEQNTLVEEAFQTLDDPDQVISHNYTRARGTKYGSSYFMMFSYEDANEADNFAYNSKTLSLDFYGDPEKDYLPAGTYEVKESTEPNCVSSYRYSTYGYDNGVQLKSGAVVVAIDPETKAYSFDIDLFLKDGRHLKATYNGDVDNMPVIDIVTIATTCSEASATTEDNGKNWALTLADAEGNTAVFYVANAFEAPYLAKNTYTISTSTEEFSAGALAAENGQFDNATSYFVVAGDANKYKFAKGTLNVDIDWTNQKYMMTFYGELENGYVIELQYNDAVEGISLAQSEEIISVMMNVATARSFENNTNWYMTFTKSENGAEVYRLVLDAFCPAMDYLPAGTYTTAGAIDGCRLNADGSSLYIVGEGQYSPKEARAEVSIDMAAKTYTFNISFRIEDGRTFAFAYVGKVDGMEIVDAEEVPDAINWTLFSAKHWYSDNWELKVEDADGAYKLVFDLRCGDSSYAYLPAGVYELDVDEAMYIDGTYSMFNGNKNAFKAAVLSLQYNEATNEHTVLFDVTLTDGRNLTGNYTGVLASH